MASIGIEPIVLKNVLLSFGTDSYEKNVSGVEFVPSVSQVNWKGLHPDAVHTDVSKATWVCNLNYAQDWETADSLSQYLLEHEGETVSATFEPVNGGAGFTADLVITPGAIGGQVDAVATASVSLGVKGRPVLVPAT